MTELEPESTPMTVPTGIAPTFPLPCSVYKFANKYYFIDADGIKTELVELSNLYADNEALRKKNHYLRQIAMCQRSTVIDDSDADLEPWLERELARCLKLDAEHKALTHKTEE